MGALRFSYPPKKRQRTHSRGADCSRQGRAARGCRPDRSHRSFAAGPCAPTRAQARAQDRPVAEAMIPPAAASDQSGSSSVNAAEQRAKETQAEAGAGVDQPQLARTETQDPRPTAQQQEVARALTDLRPRMQCNVDLCAAIYRSFHAADCTYQPYRGGPRSFCELTTRSADGLPQTSPAATDPRSEARDTRVAERPGRVRCRQCLSGPDRNAISRPARPCTGLSMLRTAPTSLMGRTAACLRVIGEAQPPRGGEEPLAGSIPSFADLRVRT